VHGRAVQATDRRDPHSDARRSGPARDTLAAEAAAWANQRNEDPTPIRWHFTTDDARVKLRHLDPQTGA